MTRQRTDEHDLWQELERIHGEKLPAAVRAFLIAQHGRPPASAPGAALAAMARTLANLAEAGLWPADEDRRLKLKLLAAPDAGDPRWRLVRKLHKRRAELLGEAAEPPWSPLKLAQHRKSGTVAYSFDSRLSDESIQGALASELPRLRKAGWLAPGEPVGKRALALVHYVCLVCRPGQSWQQRVAGWCSSAAVAAHPAWGKVYRSKQAARRFASDFHRAEAALTGAQGALALFYDPVVAERAGLRSDKAAVDTPQRQPSTSQGDLSSPEMESALGRVLPGQGEALRARFAAGVHIEELAVRALAGDLAAGDEAIALCRRWRPTALPELLARLGRLSEDGEAPDGPAER
jgi:hypothetical protein